MQEWGGKPPNTFLGSYRLEYDRSWTPLDEIREREKDIAAIHATILAAAPEITHPNPCKKDDGNSSDVVLFK